MATQTASKTSFKKRRDQVMNSVKDVNCKVIDFTEDMIDETVATGTKYQKLAAHAIKRSEPIIEKQIDILFDTAEMTFDHLQANSKRLQRLLGITKQVKKANTRFTKFFKSVSDRVEDGIEDAKETFDKTKDNSIKIASSLRKEVEKNIENIKDEVESSQIAKSFKARVNDITETAKEKATTAKKTVRKSTRSTAKKATDNAKKATASAKRTVKATAKKATKAAPKRRTAKKSTAKRTAKK